MNNYWAKSLASLGICLAGIYWMDFTNGSSGIGWICFGLFIIWAMN
jgi:hypothetical protein